MKRTLTAEVQRLKCEVVKNCRWRAEAVAYSSQLAAHRVELIEALRDIQVDCMTLARGEGIDAGERRAWKAIAAKARHAIEGKKRK